MKAGEMGEWDGVVPAEHCLDVRMALGILSKTSLKASSCEPSSGARLFFWECGGEKQAPLTLPGCFSYNGTPRLVRAEHLSKSRRVRVNGRGPPRSTPAAFQEGKQAY